MSFPIASLQRKLTLCLTAVHGHSQVLKVHSLLIPPSHLHLSHDTPRLDRRRSLFLITSVLKKRPFVDPHPALSRTTTNRLYSK